MKPYSILRSCGVALLSVAMFGMSACVGVQEPNDSVSDDEPIAEAAQALTHSCKLGFDCHTDQSGIVTNLSANGSQATYKIRMTGYRRMDVFATVCNPSGWWLHLADSPTNNGWGGDGQSTDHDAEVHTNGAGVSYYSAWDMGRGEAGTTAIANNVYPGGCKISRMTAFHAANSPVSTFRYFADNANPTPSLQVSSLHGFKIGYSLCASSSSSSRAIECDWEDNQANNSLADQNYWYIGVNRTVADAMRNGSGVSSVCIVLDSDINANPSSCGASVPNAYCGDGACNNGETSASCAADCDSGCAPLTGDPNVDSLITNPCLAAQ